MNEKPPFEAVHNCICAYADTPILEFYKGYFDAVYILLHPFYKLDEQGKVTQLISWADMLTLTGFKDINQLDIALRNSIGGLTDKWRNDGDVEILEETYKSQSIKTPYEGQFQEGLESLMLLSLQEQGHYYMFVADEFGLERKLVDIQNFLEGKENVMLQAAANCWYTSKNEILYTVHWDSHFTLLCADKSTIESILEKHPFEGFYCGADTEIYWSCRASEKRLK